MLQAAHKPLNLHGVGTQLTAARPGLQKTVSIDSPAIEVMTDFRKVMVATISPEETIATATQTMKMRGVRLLLVEDNQHQVIGLITARDTMGEKSIKMAQELSMRHDLLTGKDCMAPRNCFDVLTLDVVEKTEIGNIIATLKAVGRQHALVLGKDIDGSDMICGVFSITQIGRQLGVVLEAFEVAKTFSEIEKALA